MHDLYIIVSNFCFQLLTLTSSEIFVMTIYTHHLLGMFVQLYQLKKARIFLLLTLCFFCTTLICLESYTFSNAYYLNSVIKSVLDSFRCCGQKLTITQNVFMNQTQISCRTMLQFSIFIISHEYPLLKFKNSLKTKIL